jgi:hypothetical protein
MTCIDFRCGDPNAKMIAKTYLDVYLVQASEIEIPALEVGETRRVPAVRCGSTVLEHWRRLLGYVDGTLMKEKRDQSDEPDPEFWRLTSVGYARNGKTGRSYEIRGVCQNSLGNLPSAGARSAADGLPPKGWPPIGESTLRPHLTASQHLLVG